MPGDQVRQFRPDLLSNSLVLGGFLRSKPPVANDTLHGRCLLGTSKAVTGYTVSASISSNATIRCRPVLVSPNTTGRPEERLTSASVAFWKTSSTSSLVTPCSAQCCTLPSGSSSRSQRIESNGIARPSWCVEL